MLGSHNSFTYKKAKYLISRLFNRWSKCQDKDIENQYKCGVRYFDLRVRYGNDKSWYICHNITTYSKVEDITKELELLNSYGDTHVRILLDMRQNNDGYEDFITEFKELVKTLEIKYPNIDFDSAKVFYNWVELKTPKLEVIEWHSSVSSKWYEWFFLGCKGWARLNNKKYTDNNDLVNSKDTVLLIDFV